MRDGSNRARTAMVLGAAIALVVTASPPSVGKGRAPRVESQPYTGAQAVSSPEDVWGAYVGACSVGEHPGCVRFQLRKTDRYFDVEVVDAHGQPVYAVVWGPDGSEAGDVCGQTDAPIASPGGYIDVWVTDGSCYSELQPSVATSGEITVTFRRTR